MDFCNFTALRCACECFLFFIIFRFLADKDLNDSICLELEKESILEKYRFLSDSYVTADPKKNANSMGELRTENLFTILKLMNK